MLGRKLLIVSLALFGSTRAQADVPHGLEAKDLEGNIVSPSMYRGVPKVIAFLSSGCEESESSLQTMKKLTQDFAPKGVKLIAVFDEAGTAEKTSAKIRQENLNLEVWIDSHKDVPRVPAFLFVDASDRVVGELVGNEPIATLEKQTEALLPTDKEEQPRVRTLRERTERSHSDSGRGR